ncbi:MAG: hypothetical protein WCO25_02500 [Candidatus Uhrbacteria bacterium]
MKRSHPEGLLPVEIAVDLSALRRDAVDFYDRLGLADLAATLPPTIDLSRDQLDVLRAKAREGYSRVLLIPAGIERHLPELLAAFPVDRSARVTASWPDGIVTTDPRRVGRSYLLLTNPDRAMARNTLGRSAAGLAATFETTNRVGLTIAEFLVEERVHFETTGAHLVDRSTGGSSWLLGSRDKEGNVLYAAWNANPERLRIGADPETDRYPALGARDGFFVSLG